MWRSRAWNSLPGFQLSQRKGVPGTPKGQYNQKHNGNSEVANTSKSHLHVSHANICLGVLLKCCSVPHQLQLKIITLFLGQMKGLHQQPHGLVTSPAQKMEGFFFLKSRSTFISIFYSQLWVCYKASNEHGNKLSSSISHLRNSFSFRKD